jgi:hypothetical protein
MEIKTNKKGTLIVTKTATYFIEKGGLSATADDKNIALYGGGRLIVNVNFLFTLNGKKYKSNNELIKALAETHFLTL